MLLSRSLTAKAPEKWCLEDDFLSYWVSVYFQGSNSLLNFQVVKLTWHWKIPMFNRKYIVKWWIVHCHVSFQGYEFQTTFSLHWRHCWRPSGCIWRWGEGFAKTVQGGSLWYSWKWSYRSIQITIYMSFTEVLNPYKWCYNPGCWKLKYLLFFTAILGVSWSNLTRYHIFSDGLVETTNRITPIYNLVFRGTTCSGEQWKKGTLDCWGWFWGWHFLPNYYVDFFKPI